MWGGNGRTLIPLFLTHSTPCLCVVHHLVFHDLTYYKETTIILPAPPNTLKRYTVCVETYVSYMYAHTEALASTLCVLMPPSSSQYPNIVLSSSVSTLTLCCGFLPVTALYLCCSSWYSVCPAPSPAPRIAQEGDFLLSSSLQCSRVPSGWLRYCTMLEKDGRLSASGFL